MSEHLKIHDQLEQVTHELSKSWGFQKPDFYNDGHEPWDFPIGALPPVLRNMAQAVSKAMRCPIEYSGLAIIAINAALTGKALYTTWMNRKTTPNLFMVLGGESGT